jgi:hypothetical protein
MASKFATTFLFLAAGYLGGCGVGVTIPVHRSGSLTEVGSAVQQRLEVGLDKAGFEPASAEKLAAYRDLDPEVVAVWVAPAVKGRNNEIVSGAGPVEVELSLRKGLKIVDVTVHVRLPEGREITREIAAIVSSRPGHDIPLGDVILSVHSGELPNEPLVALRARGGR